jgi:hypothetical protein
MSSDLKDLFARADAYAEFAVKNLTLEHVPHAPLPEADQNSTIANLIQQIDQVQTGVYAEIRRHDYIVLFIFPCLPPQERAFISIMHVCGVICKAMPGTPLAEKALDAFDLAKHGVAALEPKFSLLQMEALEDDYFNWPDSHPEH